MKEQSLLKLSIKNAVFYAYHGVKAEEQDLGGKYEVDLDLYYDAQKAIINDSVKFAINYEDALLCAEEIILNENYHLIETVTSEIANSLFDKFPILQKVTVKVRKLGAPIRRVIDFVESEITISKSNRNI